MEAALALRRQELALESEVEMEQRVADFVNERESEMLSNLEKQLAKRGELSKKEVSEIIKTLESEIRVKMKQPFWMQGIVRWSTMSPSLNPQK